MIKIYIYNILLLNIVFTIFFFLSFFQINYQILMLESIFYKLKKVILEFLKIKVLFKTCFLKQLSNLFI